MSNEKISNYLNYFKDYLPLILVAFYCLGYSKMIGYYSVYNIDIEYYLNLNDFIFVAIKDLIKILIILFSVDFSSIILFFFFQMIFYRFIYKKPWKEAVKEGNKQGFEEKLGSRAVQKSFLMTLIALIIWGIFFRWFEAGFVYLCMAAAFQMARVAILDSTSLKIRKLMYIIFLIFSLIGGFYLWGRVEAKEVPEKQGISDRDIIFSHEDEHFSSRAENQIFLGETTEHIFFYDPKNKSTKVILKENIKGFQIIKGIDK